MGMYDDCDSSMNYMGRLCKLINDELHKSLQEKRNISPFGPLHDSVSDCQPYLTPAHIEDIFNTIQADNIFDTKN